MKPVFPLRSSTSPYVSRSEGQAPDSCRKVEMGRKGVGGLVTGYRAARAIKRVIAGPVAQLVRALLR